MEITGAIFDFDGTLFDSMQIWAGIKERYLAHHGITLTQDDYDALRGFGCRKCWGLQTCVLICR